MTSLVLSTLLIIFFAIIPPLFLWGYGSVYLSDHVWNRRRFFTGIIGGGISIGAILIFKSRLLENGLYQIALVVGIFVLLALIVWGVTAIGSPYIRGFLRQTLLLHIGLLSLFVIFWGYAREYIPLTLSDLSLLGGMIGFFLAASLEEGVKHVSSIGLTARDFRFSRVDFLLFTFFVTLGFVAFENFSYLIGKYEEGPMSIALWGISRLFFALPIHIFAASVCVMFWWKALAYEIFSWRYISYFISGYILATLIHSLYNSLVIGGHLGALIVLSVIAYIAFTQWILLPEEKS